jgi:hypothetical protein
MKLLLWAEWVVTSLGWAGSAARERNPPTQHANDFAQTPRSRGVRIEMNWELEGRVIPIEGMQTEPSLSCYQVILP